MTAYREPGPGAPSGDPLFVEPGAGLRGIWVGRATPDDVLRVFGSDAQVARYDDGDVFEIDYDYCKNDDDSYEPDRPAQRTRPQSFKFEFGLLKAIEIGANQEDLVTTGRLRHGASRAKVLRALGEPDARLRSEGFESVRYLDLGIQVDIDDDDDNLMSYTIFAGRRA